tara:strand:- start:748 stop:936 length:189 start_codon:yes stop_codon:yes gene_type:complete
MNNTYWMYSFDNSPNPMAYGPLDRRGLDTKAKVIAYIRRQHETTEPITVWRIEPWWTQRSSP